ncbi:efflux RND transporter periplasmic adaptor subunit [Ferrimonas balearica]|uniref:efflux RND transporter periplasmic adaptor subunit n=1 Tax=Ferrimonas balearica TaxID=44012 RepID=UPI001C99A37D|nr:efflux RND transporter periplasmic adaptor subunit [Ferrimonas balearica]MBY5994144.1 efflux RND transporter periplasmic adaptor subunit [Ferrimonas balearica]
MKPLLSLLALAALSVHAADAPPAPPAPLVSVTQAQSRDLAPTMTVTGTVHSRHDAQITASVDGRLDWVAEPGTRVRAGEVLARIDKTELALRVAEYEAEIERAGIRHRQLSREADRLETLARSNSAAASALDKAVMERDLAGADQRLAQARLAQLQDRLARTDIRAPFDGIVTERRHRAGEYVVRAEPLLSVTDPDRLEIRLHAPLRYSRSVKEADPLRIWGSDGEFQGRISRVIPVSDPRSQTFEVRVSLAPELERRLAVGELVSAALPIGPQRPTLVIPRDATVLRSSGAHLFRLNDQNQVEQVSITLGQGQGEWIAIEGDVQPGDRVVIRGAETLSAGQQVRLSEEVARRPAGGDPASEKG